VNHSLVEILWLKVCSKTELYFIACVYHPPKPKYDWKVFQNELAAGIDAITHLYPSSIIVVAGDFNQLDTSVFEVDYGLSQLVDSPTNNDNLLDKVFTNRSDLYNAHCFASLLKTKHLAVLVSVQGHNFDAKRLHRSYKATVYDLRSHNIDKLRYF